MKNEYNKRLENILNAVIKKLWQEYYGHLELKIESDVVSYWESKGKYQTAYEQLSDSLIPRRGRCGDDGPEALRLLANAYYRLYNDGDKIPASVYEKAKYYLNHKYQNGYEIVEK